MSKADEMGVLAMAWATFALIDDFFDCPMRRG
jgi:hypothetical protein